MDFGPGVKPPIMEYWNAGHASEALALYWNNGQERITSTFGFSNGKWVNLL